MPTQCRRRDRARLDPVSRALPGQQEDLRLLASEPARHVIAPESALQRTVYLEKTAQAGVATAFSISYELTVYAQYTAIDASKVVPANITAELAPFVAERAPHIVFSEDMRAFSREVVGRRTPSLSHRAEAVHRG